MEDKAMNNKTSRMQGVKKATIRAGKGLWKSTPIILGTLLLIGLIYAFVPKSVYVSVFSKNPLLDSIIGDVVGSISAGNPVTSYILGGELLKQGVSWIAITAFLVAWVTVGTIQIPAESEILGKRFAILRNVSAFVLAIIVAILTVVIVGML